MMVAMVNKAVRNEFSRMGISYTLFGVIATAAQSVVLFAIIFAVTFREIALHGIVTEGALGITSDSTFLIVLSMITMYLVAFPILYLMIRKLRPYPPERHALGFGRGMLLFIIGICAMMAGALIGNMVSYGISSLTGAEISNSTIDAISEMDPIPTILVSVIIGPVMEELMFRKFLIDRLRIFGEKKIMVLSALMFALFHTNVYQFFYAFLLGLVLAYIYLRTGRIRYTILFHMLINFLFGAVPMLFLTDTTEAAALLEQGDLSALTPGLVAAIVFSLLQYGLALVGLILFFMNIKRAVFQPQPYEIPKGLGFKTVYLAPGIALFIIAYIVLTAASILMEVIPPPDLTQQFQFLP